MKEIDVSRHIDETEKERWWLQRVVKRSFVPLGRVRAEYWEYQFWDSLQGLCSYVRGVLSTSAVLEASGVGKEGASAAAAAAAWVFRDGFATVGSLLLSCTVAANFDKRSKQWRLFADVILDVGLTLDLLSPRYFVVLASLAALCKTACGVAAGATKAVTSAHMALEGNFGDVAAKENAQETAVTLIGMVFGFFVVSTRYPYALFGVLTALHVYCNWRAVRSLQFDTLNTPRAVLLFDAYITRQRVLDPGQIARIEPVFASVPSGVILGGRCWPWHPFSRNFQLITDRVPLIVVLRVGVSHRDMLFALFCARAHLLKMTTTSMETAFEACCQGLQRAGWNLDHPLLDVAPFRYDDDDDVVPNDVHVIGRRSM